MRILSNILVTVVMGVYNQHNTAELEEAVQSILAQSMREWELIICDDGSEGEAARNLKNYENRDPRIRVIRHSENKGLAATLNTCIAQAKGKYIARMDADDISRPKRLERQYQFLEKHIQYAFAGCNADLIDENGIWGARIMPEKPEKRDFLPFSPFIHPSVMVRREVYLMSGGYYVSKETWRCEIMNCSCGFMRRAFAAITCRNGCSVIGKTGPAMSGESFGIVWMKRESGGGILKTWE